MQTNCLIDIINKSIQIEPYSESKRLIVDFILVGEEYKKYDCSELDFGYQLMENNDYILQQESWPGEGVRYALLQPGIITSGDIKLKIDTDYTLLCWLSLRGFRETALYKFNSGKPFRPYDSMVWNEETEEWDMPKPYPEDEENYYVWNEERLDWEIFDPEKDV
jgi:hypothetical protein